MTSSSPAVSSTHPFVAKTKKFFIRVAIVIVLLAAATVAFLMLASYGDGYRVGTIVKMSRKGMLFKTWEGELTQGFLESGAGDAGAGGVATRMWYFTVDGDPVVLSAIDHAIQANKKVKLYYKEKYTLLPWVGDTRQIVFKVDEVQ